jgi:hypothetical protein
MRTHPQANLGPPNLQHHQRLYPPTQRTHTRHIRPKLHPCKRRPKTQSPKQLSPRHEP